MEVTSSARYPIELPRRSVEVMTVEEDSADEPFDMGDLSTREKRL